MCDDARPIYFLQIVKKFRFAKVFHLPGTDIFVLFFYPTPKFSDTVDQIMITNTSLMYTRYYYVRFVSSGNMINQRRGDQCLSGCCFD